jgi:hypothetical protein
MRNLLALIGAALVLFAGLGWYLGWYKFALEPGANGNQRIQIDLDTHKIAEDVEKAGKTVGSAVQGATKAEQPSAQPADFVGPPLPPDMPPRGATTAAPPPPGQFTLPTPRRN